jgi:hypothetical protein
MTYSVTAFLCKQYGKPTQVVVREAFSRKHKVKEVSDIMNISYETVKG